MTGLQLPRGSGANEILYFTRVLFEKQRIIEPLVAYKEVEILTLSGTIQQHTNLSTYPALHHQSNQAAGILNLKLYPDSHSSRQPHKISSEKQDISVNSQQLLYISTLHQPSTKDRILKI